MTRDTKGFAELTEGAGTKVTREGADMIHTRYDFGGSLAKGKRVLEIACGPGIGLGLLKECADYLVGGDLDMALLRPGHRYYGDRVPLVRFDAQKLPFRDQSFDLVLFFEASYYVRDMEKAFDGVARVLRPEGSVVFVNANPERLDFIPSPKSVHYHSADGFREALAQRGFGVTVAGAFPVDTGRRGAVVLQTMRRLTEKVGLIPRTLKGRALLKRLLFGRLLRVPDELDGNFGATAHLTALDRGKVRTFKVIYVTGTREVGDSNGAHLLR